MDWAERLKDSSGKIPSMKLEDGVPAVQSAERRSSIKCKNWKPAPCADRECSRRYL